MVIFHTGVKEKPCVNSNITSSCEEDAQASVGSQKEDIDPQFKISTWFKTPLFYQVVICDKVFKNGLSRIYAKQPFKICSNMICLNRPYHFKFFKGILPQILLCLFVNILTHLFFQSLVCHQLLKSFFCHRFICMVFSQFFFGDLQGSVHYWQCNRQYVMFCTIWYHLHN